MTHAELLESKQGGSQDLEDAKLAQGYPYPFGSAKEMLRMGRESGLSIAKMKQANEIAHSENLGGQGPTEDKKDNPATRFYVLCQALTPIGLP